MGQFRRVFFVHKPNGKVQINKDNFSLVREWFGDFIVHTLRLESAGDDVLIVPVPSKDGVISAESYRTLDMLREAMSGKNYEECVTDAIRWTEKLQPAHEGGGRSRDFWRSHMKVSGGVSGKAVILVDDVISTGSTLLASKEAIEAAGGNVLAAIACGRTIYDFNTRPFGLQSIWIEQELNDYQPTT